MSRSFNQVILLGHLGRDAEVGFTASGVGKVSFSVATSRRWKDQKTGEWKEETTWTNVIAWRQEKLGEYLKKGSRVHVVGSLQTRSYDKAGEKRYTTEVVADEVILLGGNQPGGRDSATNSSRPSASSDQVDDDDIPF